MQRPTPNPYYPGRPDYTGPRAGVALALHHDRVCAEWDRAWAEFARVCAAHQPELLALLAEYVPDHTWDGERFVYPEAESWW